MANNEVRLNYGVGITVQGGSTIKGNEVHDNGEMGLGGNGDNILVEGNNIHANGFWSGIDPTWEGGGTKFAQTNNLIVRDNYSHDNHGLGLWTDIDNINTLYEGNVVVDNDGGGISHEISTMRSSATMSSWGTVLRSMEIGSGARRSRSRTPAMSMSTETKSTCPRT